MPPIADIRIRGQLGRMPRPPRRVKPINVADRPRRQPVLYTPLTAPGRAGTYAATPSNVRRARAGHAPRPYARSNRQLAHQQRAERDEQAARERTRAHYRALRETARARREGLRAVRALAARPAAARLVASPAAIRPAPAARGPSRVRDAVRLSLNNETTYLPALRIGAKVAATAAKTGRDVGLATYEAPTDTLPRTAVGLGHMVLAAPAAVGQIAVDTVQDGPRRTAEAIKKNVVADFGRRYDRAGTRANVERVKREGFAPELVDAASVASVGGVTAGRVAGASARRGSLGAKAHRAATAPRPRLRVTPARSIEQPVSRNLFTAVAQRARDRARQAVSARRATSATGARGLRPAPGEVVRIRRVTQRRHERHRASGAQSRTHQAQRTHQAREIHSGARKEIAGLNRAQRRALFPALQGMVALDSPGQAVGSLKARRAQIVAERERLGTPPRSRLQRRSNDELPVIEHAIRNAERIFTPALKAMQAREAERAVRVERGPGALIGRQRVLEAARLGPQAHVLGIKNPVRQAEKAIDRAERRGKMGSRITPEAKAARAAKRRVVAARVRAAEAKGAAEVRVRQESRAALDADEAYVSARREVSRAATELAKARRGARNVEKAPRLYSRGERAAAPARLAAAEAAAGRARAAQKAEYQRVAQSPRSPLGRRPKAALARLERERAGLAAAETAYRAAREQARRANVTRSAAAAARRQLHERAPELLAPHIAQTRAAARRAGLPEPAFISHRDTSILPRSPFTAGTGAHGAMAAPKARKGILLKTGTANTTPGAYLNTLARTIKYSHQWPMVDRIVREHAQPLPKKGKALDRQVGRRGVDPERMTGHDWQRWAEANNLNLGDWGVYQPGRLARAAGAPDGTAGRARSQDAPEVNEGVRDAIRPLQGLESAPGGERFLSAPGARLVTRTLLDEVESSTRPAGPAGRLAAKLTGAQSLAMLGLSPAWLQMQVASNAALSAFETKGSPAAYVRGPLQHRALTRKERDVIDEWMGTGVLRGHAPGTHIGAASQSWWAKSLDAIGDIPAVQRARESPANPMHALFWADDLNNRFFKRAVFHSKANRETWQRMAQTMSRIAYTQQRARGAFSGPPQQQLRETLRNRDAFERIAQDTLDLMGDYSRYTGRERRWLKSNIIFYGFLRYATRMAFYTLPVKHPVVAGLIGQLGNLHVNEVKDILGGEGAPWAYGRVYIDKAGPRPGYVDPTRANPLTSPITEMLGKPGRSISVFPPLVTSILNQAAERNIALDRGYRVGDSAREAEDLGPFFSADRNRIFANEMLSLAAPYRIARAGQVKGPQADTSLLGSPRAIVPRTVESIRRERDREASRLDPLHTVLPFLPRRDASARRVVARLAEGAARERARNTPVGRQLARVELQIARLEAAWPSTEEGGRRVPLSVILRRERLKAERRRLRKQMGTERRPRSAFTERRVFGG